MEASSLEQWRRPLRLQRSSAPLSLSAVGKSWDMSDAFTLCFRICYCPPPSCLLPLEVNTARDFKFSPQLELHLKATYQHLTSPNIPEGKLGNFQFRRFLLRWTNEDKLVWESYAYTYVQQRTINQLTFLWWMDALIDKT